MNKQKINHIHEAVRDRYGKIARSEEKGCGCSGNGCCGTITDTANTDSLALGYSAEERNSVPEGADLGLGCGNPQAIASLKPGETVLDLGSGAGFDCFLAARTVGETGQVIGVDMTPDMITKATENARKNNVKNVEFRQGMIEDLPVDANNIDVIISNCVINLSPDKAKVYGEAFRVLKSGGRLAVSDVVKTAQLPEEPERDMALYTGCMAGASAIPQIESFLKQSGFKNIKITPKGNSREFIREWVPGSNIEDFIVSAAIEAIKP